MNSISIPNVSSAVKPAASATAGVKPALRVSYIDMLRGFLIALVIVFHAACTYNGSEDWTFRDLKANDPVTEVGLYFFVIYCQSFFMSLYFFLSGVFTPGAYDRKGVGRYWLDRVVHLLIPALIYTLAVSRIPNYLTAITNYGVRDSFWKFSANTFWTEADAGPTWFVFAVLLFSGLYTLVRIVANKLTRTSSGTKSWIDRVPAPGIGQLLITALVMAAGMFIVGQFMSIVHAERIFGAIPFIIGFFPFYLVFFFGGVLAYRNHWLEQWQASPIKFWGTASIMLVVLLPVLLVGGGALENGIDIFLSGFTWRCAATCLWLALACVSFGMSLTLWMREHVRNGSRLAAFVGKNSFTVFLIHSAILVGVSVSISGYDWHPLIKFAVSSVVAVPACFLVAWLLRKIPGLKQAL